MNMLDPGKGFSFRGIKNIPEVWTCSNSPIPLNCESPPKDELPNQFGLVDIKR